VRSVHQDPENMVSRLSTFLPKQKLILLHKFWGCQEKDLKIPQATNRSLEWRGQETTHRLITSEQVVQHPYRVVLHGQQPEPVEKKIVYEVRTLSNPFKKEKETGYVYQQQWYQCILLSKPDTLKFQKEETPLMKQSAIKRDFPFFSDMTIHAVRRH
jgi:hypothetical protein